MFSDLKSLFIYLIRNIYIVTKEVRYKFVDYNNNSILLPTHCFYKHRMWVEAGMCLYLCSSLNQFDI